VCTGFYSEAIFENDGTMMANIGLSGDGDCEEEVIVAMGYFFAPPVPSVGCAAVEGWDLECDASTQTWAS